MSDIREPNSPIHPPQHKLVRSLDLLDVVMIGIAGMIGGSIFCTYRTGNWTCRKFYNSRFYS